MVYRPANLRVTINLFLHVCLNKPHILCQIVPVKVKYFQTVPNETKRKLKNWNRINWL
jgi:hypothetical protein